MTPTAKKELKLYLDDHFGKHEAHIARRLQHLVMANRISDRKRKAYFKALAEQKAIAEDIEKQLPVTGRVNILQKVAEQRRKREQIIHAKADEWERKRAKGQEIVLPGSRKRPPPTTDGPPSSSLSERVSGLVDKVR